MAVRTRRHKWIVVIVLVAMVVLAGLVFRSFSTVNAEIDESSLARVERGNLARSVVATGVVEPISNRVELRSRASGIVEKLHRDVGDRVRAGEALIELDREQLLAQLREAKANLAAAAADVRAARAELERYRIQAEDYDVRLARTNHARSRELHEAGLIPKAEYDIPEGALDEALNRQRAAMSAISSAEAAIAQKEARVLQFEAVIDRITEELGYTTIRSPIDGVVLSRAVEVGSAVSSITTMGAGATMVMVLGDMSAVYVKGRVNENDIGLAKIGLPARITVETFKERVFHGKVYKIAPLGVEEDNVTTFEVRVSVENPEGLLLANMSANAEIILEEHEGTLIVPEGAVIYERDRSAFVEVPDPGSESGKRRVAVELGISNGTKSEVVSGLEEGAPVVLQ